MNYMTAKDATTGQSDLLLEEIEKPELSVSPVEKIHTIRHPPALELNYDQN